MDARPTTKDARAELLHRLIVQADLAMGRHHGGSDLGPTVKSWEYAIGHIPTHHLEECFTRAIRAKTDSFPFSAPEVNRQWDELKQELIRNPPPQDDIPLLAPATGYLTIEQFKARHGLPAEWKLGDPYPPGSDLYGRGLPEREQEWVSCPRCKDAGWTRLPYNAALQLPPKLIRCECQGGE